MPPLLPPTKTAQHASLFTRLKCRNSGTLKEHASGANMYARSQSFFANHDTNHDSICLPHWAGHGALMSHTIATKSITQTANRNGVLPIQRLLFPLSISLLAKKIQTKHPCTFTKLAFRGAILRKKILLRRRISFSVSPSFRFHFTANETCPFTLFVLFKVRFI